VNGLSGGGDNRLYILYNQKLKAMHAIGIGISTIVGGKVLAKEARPKNAAITESDENMRLLNIRFW
jgi:hypothetical protein